MIDVGAPDFTLGVVGAGAMGSGIAQGALTGSMAVILTDANAAQLDKVRAALFARIDRLAEKRELKPELAVGAKARLTLAREIGALAPCGVVVEAIVEDLAIKRDVFPTLEGIRAGEGNLRSHTLTNP